MPKQPKKLVKHIKKIEKPINPANKIFLDLPQNLQFKSQPVIETLQRIIIKQNKENIKIIKIE